MDLLNIITRCTRPENLLEIKKTIFTKYFNIRWYILFDTNVISKIDSIILLELMNSDIYLKFMKGDKNGNGFNMVNDILDYENISGWIYILDDDTIIHEKFYEYIHLHYKKNLGLIFDQRVNGLDFTGLDVRKGLPENVKVGGIDVGQYLINIELIGNNRFGNEYVSDGKFIHNIYVKYPDKFYFLNEELSYYNYFSFKSKKSSLTKVLVIGQDINCNDLNIKCIPDDKNIDHIIQEFNPNSIITIGDNFGKFSNLCSKNYEVRRKWVHLENTYNIFDISYRVAMNSILNTGDSNILISFFTSIYNIGDKLWRLYKSLKEQTYSNWEWIIVDDSSDNGRSFSVARNIAKVDCRVKIYEFGEKTGGIIGDAKYRAACLCTGEYIMEIDHDDYILPDAGYWMVEAFKNPLVKFVYSDFAEVIEGANMPNNCIVYPPGFCFGYGSYRKEIYNGVEYSVMNSLNINPKTIRHIVGVPNHFRAWERKFYHSIGGHNRNLSIADDYELLIRTFLNTRMLRIPKLLYLQYRHNNNTQDATRSDIQKRVNSISHYYNDLINKRFTQLGKNDWAYNYNSVEPLLAESRFGAAEEYVNFIFSEQPATYLTYKL